MIRSFQIDNDSQSFRAGPKNLKIFQEINLIHESTQNIQKERKFGRDISQINNKPQVIFLNKILPFKQIKSQQTKEQKIENSYVVQYQKQILRYFLQCDQKLPVLSQIELNEKMRAILIDWIISVHRKMNFKQETLFQTINIVDRFLIQKQVKRKFFQLIGITSLFMASKFQEIYIPNVSSYAYVTDNAYSVQEIIEMEAEIFLSLNFQIHFICRYDFLIVQQAMKKKFEDQSLLKNCQSLNQQNENEQFCQMMLEMSLIDQRIQQWSEYQISQAVLILSQRFGLCDNQKQKENQEIENCVEFMYDLFLKRNNKYFFEIQKKYKNLVQKFDTDNLNFNQ